MAFFKVEKKMMYTEVVWVEADSKSEADDMAGGIDGTVMGDDHWHDSEIIEVCEQEYEENA